MLYLWKWRLHYSDLDYRWKFHLELLLAGPHPPFPFSGALPDQSSLESDVSACRIVVFTSIRNRDVDAFAGKDKYMRDQSVTHRLFTSMIIKLSLIGRRINKQTMLFVQIALRLSQAMRDPVL